MAVLKIKPEHEESQGKFVLINAEDFDPNRHELYEEQKQNPDPDPDSDSDSDSDQDKNLSAKEGHAEDPADASNNTKKRGHK